MEDRKVKQVIVVRDDIVHGPVAKVHRGKLVAQGSHASLGALLSMFDKVHYTNQHGESAFSYSVDFTEGSVLDNWLNGVFTKVCLKVNDDAELVALYEKIKAENPNLPCVLITDCGLTEFNGEPTNTCIGIGPAYADEIDVFTKDLRLL